MTTLTFQGSWVMEGDMLKGVFTRKDNGKTLTTTRVIANDELVQVGYSLFKHKPLTVHP